MAFMVISQPFLGYLSVFIFGQVDGLIRQRPIPTSDLLCRLADIHATLITF